MDTPVRVTSTEEDEIIDIEGDIDDVTIQNDVTIKNREEHCDENYTSDNGIPIPQTPFMRQKICKTPKNSDYPATENEFTKWWKSASEFQRPVTPISKRDYDIITESAGTTSELDPILQQPVKEDREISSDELDLTHYDEDGELFHPPKEEIFFSINEPSEQEREKFPEFFSGRTKYSPHNYITIRNTILKLWEEKRPEHVNKVMLRPILKKGCGNVNNVGRIHRYLESVGAINFGSDAVWWKRKRRKLHVYRPPRTALDTDFKLKRALEQRMSGRSRKRPAPMTSDLSLNDSVGGYTIDHANNNALVIPKTKEKKESSIKLISSKKFNLVKCKEYAPTEECPYEVTIHSSALVIMDVHSHLSTNEVMGLIGGHVTKYGEDKVKVQITCAQPCKSSGSKKHCEMDPVSQSFACERMMQKGLKVVGWYHSHPTFLPQPSEIDIATQLEQQLVFSSHDSVFLGVILSPYFKHQIKTQVNLVHMEPFTANGITSGRPFSISYEIDSQPLDGDMETELLTALSEIIENSIQEAGNGKTSSRLSHLLDPVVQGSSITHLDKLTKSLSSFVTSQPDNTVVSQSIDTSQSDTSVMSQSIGTSQSDTTVMSQSIGTSQSDTAHFDEELDAAFVRGVPILSSQDIMTSAYEIVTSQDVLTSPYDDIVSSQIENEDIVSSILEGDSFSIDQNFPSLAGDGFCQTDNALSHNDVKGTDDVISADDVIELPQGEDIEENRRFHPSWNDVFDQLKFLLLRASEKVLN